LVDAMVALLTDLGVEIVTDRRVESMADLPDAKAILFALTPKQVLAIVGNRFPSKYRDQLSSFRYGAGACKVDFALDGPIPWTNEGVGSASTVHVGGTLDEVVAAEQTVADGKHAERPFVLLAQHGEFDSTRAPVGGRTAWAHCHVPNGSTIDQSEAIVAQIERFAPGFRDLIRARHVTLTPQLEQRNANLVGGDIGGGRSSGRWSARNGRIWGGKSRIDNRFGVIRNPKYGNYWMVITLYRPVTLVLGAHGGALITLSARLPHRS